MWIKRGVWLLLILGLVAVGYYSVPVLKDQAAPPDCTALIVYGVRGSDSKSGPGEPAIAVYEAARARYGEAQVSLASASYPASQTSLDAYEQSVSEGAENGLDWLKQKAVECPGASFLLVGHSQGAHVVHVLMKQLEQQQYAPIQARTWALLFGDPARDPSDLDVQDYVFGGPKGGRGDYLATSEVELNSVSRGHVLSVCHALDTVCNSTSAGTQRPRETNEYHQAGWTAPKTRAAVGEWVRAALGLA